MDDYSELDAMADIAKALDRLTESGERSRTLRWVMDKYNAAPLSHAADQAGQSDDASSGKKTPPKQRSGRGASRKAVSAPSLSKELNLRPSGQQSFRDLATEKNPGSQLEKAVIAVYYLKHVLGREAVGINDVYTCFKEQGWRVPSDLRNTLQSAASHKGWLDTSNTEDIRLVPGGENLVEHDLPGAPAK